MTTQTDTDVAEIIRLEGERCKAFETGDMSIANLLADDYTHVHMPGRMEDKPAFLEGFKGRTRQVLRDNLNVRIHGDAAIMTGKQTNRIKDADGKVNDTSMMVTQTWLRQGGAWKLAAFQASRLADQ